MNKEEGRQGYAYSNLWMNEALKTKEVWNVEELEERFKLLYNRYTSIWKYPSITITEDNGDEEYTLFRCV